MEEPVREPEEKKPPKPEKKRRGKKFKAIASLSCLAALALAIFLFIQFGGFGISRGPIPDGNIPGGSTSSEAPADSMVTSKTSPVSESVSSQDASSIPLKVSVRIHEEEVTVAGRVCSDAEALKAYLESIHNDSRTYTLTEDDAILSVHDWVVAVFEDLRIPLAGA